MLGLDVDLSALHVVKEFEEKEADPPDVFTIKHIFGEISRHKPSNFGFSVKLF
jgi:hypothetical protein|tara:strand:+ start:459 stop:617 length:159 start_codon:yes stop_codon:yes gene_type:complete